MTLPRRLVFAALLLLAGLILVGGSALAQSPTTTTQTTTYPNGAVRSQESTRYGPDGTTKLETVRTEYNEDGQPSRETQTSFKDGFSNQTIEKTWTYDGQHRLAAFEMENRGGSIEMGGQLVTKYRRTIKYANDKDTKGTVQEEVYSSATGQWRPFDAEGGDQAPSLEPIQPAKSASKQQTPPAKTGGAASAAPQTFTFTLHDNQGNPLPATLAVLAGGKKFDVGTTDNNGRAQLAIAIGNLAKKDKVQVVVDKCENNQTQAYLVGPGGQLPPKKKGCKRYDAGLIFWGEDSTSTVGGELKEVSTGTGEPIVHVRIGAGFGLKRFAGEDNCAAFSGIFPSNTCAQSHNTFDFNVEAGLGITKYIEIVGQYNRANATHVVVDAAQGPNTTFHHEGSAQQQFEVVGGRVFTPEFGHMQFFVQAGGAFSQIHLRQKDTLTSGGTPNTSTDSVTVSTVGLGLGAGIRTEPFFKNMGVQFQYLHVTAQNKPVIVGHNHVLTGGVYWQF